MSIDYTNALGRHTEAVLSDERAFADIWLRQVAPLSSRVAQAVQGGLLADRLAWVFVAGYQCALRHTFAQLPAGSIAAFAVSEAARASLHCPVLPPQYSTTKLRSADTKRGWLAVQRYRISSSSLIVEIRPTTIASSAAVMD